MANIVIVRDEGGIVRVDVREGDIKREAWQVLSAFKDAFEISRGKQTTLHKEALDFDQRRRWADEVMRSTRLSDEEKEEFYTLLSGRVFHVDYYSQEYVAGEYARTHRVSDGGGQATRQTIVRVIDP